MVILPNLKMKYIFRYIDGCDVLVSIQAILTLPVVSGHYKLFKACSDFIEAMISTQKGLLYLVYNSEIVLNLVQHLMRASPSLDIEKPGNKFCNLINYLYVIFLALFYVCLKALKYSINMIVKVNFLNN